MLNNLTSSYTALCALVKYVNAYLTSVEKDSIKFGGTYEENLINLETFFSALDSLRQVVFNPESEINKQIWRVNDCCTQCGRKEHNVKNCKETQDIIGKEIIKKKLIKTWVDCQKDGNCSDNCSNKKEIFNCMDCD